MAFDEYHKIPTLFFRDATKKKRPIIEGQWATKELAYLADTKFMWTEKVDGTNIRIKYDYEKVTFSGRTESSQIYAPLIAVLQEMFTVEKLQKVFSGSATLYGEGYGPKIQKDGEKYMADGVSFVLFDVRCSSLWLERQNVEDIAAKLKLEVVPVVGHGTLLEAVKYVKERPFSCWGAFPMEGLVVRPLVELMDRRGERIIAKIKHKDFGNG